MSTKACWWLISGIILVNLISIIACIPLGISAGNISLFFQERQSITFLSALQLALISALSIFVYIIKQLLNKNNIRNLKMSKIWLISSFVFAFATADEYFMIHEGVDGGIFTFFFGITENPNLDGIVLGLYGVVALFIFFRFKEEILKYKHAIFLFWETLAFKSRESYSNCTV